MSRRKQCLQMESDVQNAVAFDQPFSGSAVTAMPRNMPDPFKEESSSHFSSFCEDIRERPICLLLRQARRYGQNERASVRYQRLQIVFFYVIVDFVRFPPGSKIRQD